MAATDLETLVTYVKDLQRSNPTAKEYWVKYTREKGDRNMDPKRHTMEFLQEFIYAVESGQAFAEAGPSSDSGGDGDLVSKIKDLQRSNTNAKEQWMLFTEIHGGGISDPARHPQSTLETFLEHLNSGGSFAGGEGSLDFVSFIKSLRRRSTSFNTAWLNFCKDHGGGMNDPKAHDAGYHAHFFEMVTQTYNAAIGDGSAGTSEPPSKKRKMSPGLGSLGGMGGMGAALSLGAVFDQSKDSFVQAIKAFQRSSKDNQGIWQKYSEDFLGSKMDPSKHDASVLLDFCINNGVPMDGSVAAAGGTGGGGARAGASVSSALASAAANPWAWAGGGGRSSGGGGWNTKASGGSSFAGVGRR